MMVPAEPGFGEQRFCAVFDILGGVWRRRISSAQADAPEGVSLFAYVSQQLHTGRFRGPGPADRWAGGVPQTSSLLVMAANAVAAGLFAVWLAPALFMLAIGAAAIALLGPLVTDVIRYPYQRGRSPHAVAGVAGLP